MPGQVLQLELVVERLCKHHKTAQFRCGDALYNGLLGAFQDKSERGDDNITYVLVGNGRRDAVGYLAVTHQWFRHVRSAQPARFFVLSAIALASDGSGSSGVRSLLKAGFAAMEYRREEDGKSSYRGVIALPHTDHLRESLLRLGFQPHDENDQLMWRLFDE